MIFSRIKMRLVISTARLTHDAYSSSSQQIIPILLTVYQLDLQPVHGVNLDAWVMSKPSC